jgi:Tol biopolymer transport system component
MRTRAPALQAAKLVASLASVVAAAVLASPAEAAYPGVAGPIAYSKVETSEAAYEGTGGIFVHGPRASDAPRQLTNDPQDEKPSYSANGRLIVFSGNRDPLTPTSPFGPPGRHIYVMKNNGGGVRQITSGDFYDSNPCFSPNGKLVVFDRAGVGLNRTSHIFSVNVDGSGLRRLTNEEGSDSDPVFAPSGKVIVFVSNRKSSGSKDRSNIFAMRPNGSRLRLLIGGRRSEYDPDISPNGRSVAFASNSRGKFGIYISRISGRHVRPLRESQGASSPSWAPDGKHIAFLDGGSESSSVDVMRADGRRYSKVFDSGGTEEEGFGTTVGAPAWGPRPR